MTSKKIIVESPDLSSDSLDDQIDSLLISYEKASIRDEDVTGEEEYSESRSLRSAYNFLFEQEDEDSPEEEEAQITGSEEQTVDEPSEERKPRIDIDNFTARTARLIMNFDSLLDPTMVIVNRARNFLGDNYDESAVDEFEEALAQQYGIELEPVLKAPPRPPADGAGPIGAA